MYVYRFGFIISKKSFSASEVLSQPFAIESDTEENMSDLEEDVEEDPDYESSSSNENKNLSAGPTDVSTSNRHVSVQNWKVITAVEVLHFQQQGRLIAANNIQTVPGPTRCVVSHVQDLKSAFVLFITFERDIQCMYVIEMTKGEAHVWV